jgi:hypothetical protein
MSDAERALAKANWDADRAWLKEHQPEWPCPAWSKAPAWRRRAYLLAAKFRKRPDDLANMEARVERNSSQ